jgi:flagellar protein FlaG
MYGYVKRAKGVAMIELTTHMPPPSMVRNTGSEVIHSSVESKPNTSIPVVEKRSLYEDGSSKKTDRLSSQNIDSLVEQLNKVSQSLSIDIKFGYNDKIDEVYISVMDKSSGREIQKLPTEQAMKIRETMKDVVGSLFDVKG